MKLRLLIIVIAGTLIGCIFSYYPRGYEEKYIYDECYEEVCPISIGRSSGEWHKVHGIPYAVTYDNVELRKKHDPLYDTIVITKEIDGALTEKQKTFFNFFTGLLAGFFLSIFITWLWSIARKRT